MKNKIFYTFITIIAISSLWMIVDKRLNNTSDGKSVDNKELSRLEIGNKTILVEVVKTEKDRAEGLSGKEILIEDTGMLFIFEKPDFYQFWMKDMNFPIDIVWLDQNYQVVDITKNLSPETYPETVSSRQPAQYVLEVNANFTNILGIKIGDKAKILTAN